MMKNTTNDKVTKVKVFLRSHTTLASEILINILDDLTNKNSEVYDEMYDIIKHKR